MTYAVEILRTAQKQLAQYDRQAQPRIIDEIRTLAMQPRPTGCKKLAGRAAGGFVSARTGSSMKSMTNGCLC